MTALDRHPTWVFGDLSAYTLHVGPLPSVTRNGRRSIRFD